MITQAFPEQWSNFFLLVGTGSATLAGLVFVALTINLRAVARDATHRFRAINMLTGFTSVFLISALVLMALQPFWAIGLEWLVIALVAGVINTIGYVQAFRLRSSLYALSLTRIVGGSLCYVGQIVGAVLILVGHEVGTYVSSISLVATFIYLVSGSWLLVMGTVNNPEDATRSRPRYRPPQQDR